ncbi:unnamed protein product [Caenorhabditis angaria]|uniref:Uncharacterized protein n=1 Tax=Caenorhabditis angaria TaxID=860376 RepID=A0A9P1IXM4_9PELO|nr:unnamed protein product [Caenorhabditis angaria]
MWRFSIIARPSIVNKISIKSLRNALKHTDTRLTRFQAPEINRQDVPIREVFSFDDFGLLSTRSASIETLESEKTFLDQILKNDTFIIPTTIDQKEVFGYDQALEMFAEGADLELLAEDLASIEESSSSTTSIVTPKKSVREEKLEKDEEEEESLFKIPKKAQALDQFMIYPEIIPNQQFTSQWTEKQLEDMTHIPTTSKESIKVVEKFELSLEVLEGMMDNKSISEIEQELKNGEWPEYLFEDRKLIARSNRVLRYIVKEMESLEAIEIILSTFAKKSMLSVISDDIILHLTTRFSKVLPPRQTIDKLEYLTTLCCSKELKPAKLLIQQSLEELYNELLQKDPKIGKDLLTICSKLNFDKSAEIFLRVLAENATHFDKDFETWKMFSLKYGSTSGVRSFWKLVLKSEENGGKKRINEILNHSNKSDHPFSTMARIICTFVEMNQMERAIEVFKLISVSGRHFRNPLLEWVDENNLECIERLAQLVEDGMIAERRRTTKKKIVDENKTDKKSEVPSTLIEAISKFCGIVEKKPKKFVDRKAKRKIHRVDEEQLHELCEALQKAWWKCSKSSENPEATSKRLVEWSQRNRLDLDEKLEKELNRV